MCFVLDRMNSVLDQASKNERKVVLLANKLDLLKEKIREAREKAARVTNNNNNKHS